MKRHSVGFLPRLGAFALDLIPILGYIFVLLACGLALASGPLKGKMVYLPAHPLIFNLIAFFFTILPVIMYFSLQESSTKMASWGKTRMGLQVVTKTGNRLSFGHASLRSAVKFLPWELAHTCLFYIPGWPFMVRTFPPLVIAGFVLVYFFLAIYFFTLLFRPHRAPYDWIAGTIVVKEERNSLPGE